jgi:hypothetical protein
MKIDKNKHNWIVDAVLFALFLISFLIDQTGLALHEGLGAAAVLLALYHLLIHWPWVAAITGRFFGRAPLQARAFYVVDFALLAGFALIGVSGLAISTWLNLPLADFEAWDHLHLMSSILTMLLVVLKIAVHWKWVLSAFRRYTTEPVMRFFTTPLAPAAAGRAGRRDFLKLMGVVGAASFVALHGVLDGAQETALAEAIPVDPRADPLPSAPSSAVQAGAPVPTATPPPSTPLEATAAPLATVTEAQVQCTYRCPNGNHCAYPGECRRYRDSNSNGLCDLGECA